MKANRTKEKILSAALDQFALRGFTAVSVRDICSAVGIKESTIYYHFTSKQDILDHLVDEFEAVATQMAGVLSPPVRPNGTATISDEGFILVACAYYAGFLNHERIHKLLHMLMIEQHNNPDLGALYARMMFDGPIEQQRGFFKLLVESGYLAWAPEEALAAAYHAVLHFCFSYQIASNQSLEEALENLKRHMGFYLQRVKA